VTQPPPYQGPPQGQPPPGGPQWAPPTGKPATTKRPWWKARWVPYTAVAFIALGVGIQMGGGPTPPTPPAPAAKTVTVSAPVLPPVTSVKPATADEQAAIDAKNKQADGRLAALDKREAALVAREKAVTAQETAIAAGTIPGDGVFLVSKDVKPGTYRTTGGVGCYWARLGDASGQKIIANNLGDGPAVVNIQGSDVAFETKGCADWKIVS